MGVTELKQAAQVTMTSSSKGPGMYPYMAPEMFKKGRRGRAVDIYSLGCLYLEVFSRRRVWPGLDSTEIMMKVCGSYDSPPFHARPKRSKWSTFGDLWQLFEA